MVRVDVAAALSEAGNPLALAHHLWSGLLTMSLLKFIRKLFAVLLLLVVLLAGLVYFIVRHRERAAVRRAGTAVAVW